MGAAGSILGGGFTLEVESPLEVKPPLEVVVGAGLGQVKRRQGGLYMGPDQGLEGKGLWIRSSWR